MANQPALLWFRLDLRLQDNPALAEAAAHGGPVIPLFIWDEAGERPWSPGAASRWWLHHSLLALQTALRDRGSDLIIRRGEAKEVLRELLRETGATALFWNRRYEPAVIARDTALKSEFNQAGIEVHSGNGSLLFEPPAIKNQSGQPFQVFTPFWKHCLSREAAPVRTGRIPPLPPHCPRSVAVAELKLLPSLRWDQGLAERWQPGEAGAQRRLKAFLNRAADYDDQRNFPGTAGTSSLSPHLHFGEISPSQVRAALPRTGSGASVFFKEIGWREFAYHLLYHFPHTAGQPLRPDFAAFPWKNDPAGLRAWQRGRTGYPIVDAGMRELWATGWMHNRVRMIAGSFLVKDLLIDWRAGAAWFWDTLVDADLASNTLGWQWTAGCGADAAPYFRIFNPTLQGEKFDPAGTYVRRTASTRIGAGGRPRCIRGCITKRQANCLCRVSSRP
jgi:deoxyribodipyrimidine photo-lyase